MRGRMNLAKLKSTAKVADYNETERLIRSLLANGLAHLRAEF
jgi:hypothetical protein